MDFSLSEEQRAVGELAAQILAGHATPERVREVEASRDRFDRELWRELARANLLGISLPEPVGGSGLGIVESCLLLEQQGRRVAPVPLLATLVSAASTIAEHGSRELAHRWLPGVVSGEVVLTAALAERGENDPLRPGATATRDRGSWRLDGSKIAVPAAHVASRVLVPARAEEGIGVFVVDPAGEGVSLERVETTDRQVQCNLVLSGAPADGVVADPARGEPVVGWMVERTMVGLCALQVGVAEEALRMAAAYTSERRQFGRPLATNQGVALRAADAYIDVEAMRATMWQAAWRLSAGLEASREIMAAKWWASEAGQRVVHTTQHLHGGLGADVDYPVHRYFLWGKQIEVTLGGASYQLARLGERIAAGAA
jgi:alkylation response protein AidB-like acyl-CoA dehydrogenase